MCNCKQEMENRIMEAFIAKFPEDTEHSVDITGYSCAIVDGELKLRPSLTVSCTSMMTYKNGNKKERKYKPFALASFCPFCGEKLNLETANNDKQE